MKEIKIDPSEFGFLAISAVRYGLGRRTYAPSLICDYIKPHIRNLTDRDLYVMLQDVEGCGDYGDSTIDKPVWMKFKQDLYDEYKKRHEKGTSTWTRDDLKQRSYNER